MRIVAGRWRGRKISAPPGPDVRPTLDSVREVYGIQRIWFEENEHIVRVLFDASRLNEDAVARLLREAGLDITDKLVLA
jgi:16S rRNA (guanine966-N2)-methyltransferase